MNIEQKKTHETFIDQSIRKIGFRCNIRSALEKYFK